MEIDPDMSPGSGAQVSTAWSGERFSSSASKTAPAGPGPQAQQPGPATPAPGDRADGFWQACLEQLQGELTPQQFTAWIKPLTAGGFDPATRQVRIGAPNRFKLDWVRNQFAGRIEAIALGYFGEPVGVDLFLDLKAPSPAPGAVRSTDGGPGPARAPRDLAEGQASEPASASNATPSASREVGRPDPRTSKDSTVSRLDPSLTFERFVTGKANQLARAAAEQVADNPGRSYNPLFLYGGVGLGKTHLIQAVGNQMMARQPHARVRYLSADQFIADVVKAYQRKAFDHFNQIYHSLDLLLIDDIQFFSRKEGTQEQFFYAFEALTAAKKQILITSDTYPAEMQGIDERLVSRFGSGLTVAIEPPELEMRVAILLKKAEQDGKPLSDDVAFFVAKHSRSNVRELEGALRKLFAHASFHGKEVTIELAREALKDMLSAQRAQISVESIQKTVADFYKIKVADMYSQRRPSNIARPRQIAMYFAKELTQKSLPEIGELFGGRDHTTVLHAVRKINELRAKMPELNHDLHVLLQTLKG